jgi:enoyl-CoA hydratase/carnithine racemase
LAVWCDLRVAASDATLGVYCRRWGVPLVDGGTVRLPCLVGHGRAMDLILTGRGVGADEARMGLVDRVVAPGTALAARSILRTNWQRSRRRVCARSPIRHRPVVARRPRRWPTRPTSASPRSTPARRVRVPRGSPQAKVDTVPQAKVDTRGCLTDNMSA